MSKQANEQRMLFSPLKVGDMQLSHRIVMAPLTRSRSPNYLANSHNALYYAQRATPGGLLISEGTTVDPTANGYPDVPALYTIDHAEAWLATTEAVHRRSGFIYAQLWHVGRLSQPQYQPNRQLQVSSSATSARKKRAPARALTIPEIKTLVKAYATSAKLAIEVAKFDGIEIHAAHGYLIEQFLNDNSNFRSDEYGGSIENRCRFLFEILDAIVEAVPASKVAIRISPECNMQGVKDSNPRALYTHVLTRLNKYNLSYIQLTEPVWGMWLPGPPHASSKLNSYRPLLNNSKTKVMLTGGYTSEIAEEALKTGRGDFIGFGRDFITNPDLVSRIQFGKPIAQYENAGSGYYKGGKELYSDYPTWEEQEASRFLLTAKL
ncbi:12-oxophytodienoate reductase 3-like protein [Obelidium mucronatum]|nr:12-oxophytodienoate reductase 3-like protein [Obelidium mucronatum]